MNTDRFFPIAFVCVTLLLQPTHSQDVNVFDCSTYTCRASPTFIPNFQTDESACVVNCPKCLVGPVWEQRLKELGAGRVVDRTVVPRLHFGNWLSIEVVSTIAAMVLNETMGYPMNGANGNVDARDVLCCPDYIIRLETWPQSGLVGENDYVVGLTSLEVGYSGYSGLFVPGYTTERHPMATAWTAYKYLSEYGNIFPRAFSTPCEQMLMNTSGPCTEDNYWCSVSIGSWQGQGPPCQKGRYVPPQCNGPSRSQYCQEIIAASPDWDVGFFEGLVNNTGINFTMAYTGPINEVAYVKSLYAQGKDIVFYWFNPDPLIAWTQAQAIEFKPDTPQCDALRTTQPYTNRDDCGYQVSPLKKIARTDYLALVPDLKNFFQSIIFTDTEVAALLALHQEGGGPMNTWNVSCNWLQNNYDIWKDWVFNTPATPAVVVVASQGVSPEVWALPVGIALVFGAVMAWFFVLRGRRVNRHAPRTPPLCLIFTDVESSTKLWQQHPSTMGMAMDIHHRTIRALIEEYSCYEVKTIGDSFMIACATVVDGAMLSVAIQEALLQQEWPDDLMHCPGEGQGPDHVWKGLRVRIGLHLAKEVAPQYDAIHQRYDYYGHDVNVAARVESQAKGGQILMTSDTSNALLHSEEFEYSLHGATLTVYQDQVTLKGVEGDVSLVQLVSPELVGRIFDHTTTKPVTKKGVGEEGEAHEDVPVPRPLVDADRISNGGPNDDPSSESSGVSRYDVATMALHKLFRTCPPSDLTQFTRFVAAPCGVAKEVPIRRQIARVIAHTINSMKRIPTGPTTNVIAPDRSASYKV